MRPFRAVEATGYGRTDWCVEGPCCCQRDYGDDCYWCDGTERVIISMGHTKVEAMATAGLRNSAAYLDALLRGLPLDQEQQQSAEAGIKNLDATRAAEIADDMDAALQELPDAVAELNAAMDAELSDD